MLANRVAILERGKVVAQDDLRSFLTVDKELYSVAFEANGTAPDYVTSVERTGNVVKADIPKDKLYDFMQYTKGSGLTLYECSLKKNSLEDSFFKLIKGVEAAD